MQKSKEKILIYRINQQVMVMYLNEEMLLFILLVVSKMKIESEFTNIAFNTSM